MEPQTYPYTYYYIRVPGEHEGTWVPVRGGSSLVPERFHSREAAIIFATDREIPECRIIEVSERLV